MTASSRKTAQPPESVRQRNTRRRDVGKDGKPLQGNLHILIQNFSADKIDEQHTQRPADEPAVKGGTRSLIENKLPRGKRIVKSLKEHGAPVPDDKRDHPADEYEVLKLCGHLPLVGKDADARARALFSGKFDKEHVSIGVSGYKIDEIDGYDRYVWPDVATFPSGVPAEQMRQTYGLWVQRITAELYRKTNQRTYGLVRGSNGGGSSFPYVIYNDYYSHKDFITALINSGFCGVLWTPEVRGSKTSEEWLRRFQSVVFSPMAMINAWSSGTKPWSFPDVTDNIREYALLRMRMMPYWYTEFARYHFDGIPPFRSISLEAGFNPEQASVEGELKDKDLETNPYLESVRKEIKDQYMAGEYLLVAPMFAGQTERTVVLPRGDWYDFYTGEYVGNGEKITVKPGLERIPVFVKDGGIIPMMEPLLHAPKAGEKINLEIRHYGKAEGSYRLYDDDGETFDYEKGAYSWREIKVTRDRKGRLKGSISKAEKGKPDYVATVSWKFMSK